MIDADSWRRPAVFDWLQRQGGVAESEMLRTFNCGVGMVVCVGSADADVAQRLLSDQGEQTWRLGRIEACEGPATVEIRGGA